MKLLSTILLTMVMTLLSPEVSGQVYFTGQAKMRISSGGKLIIHNPISDGITFTQGGGIITEDENAQVILHVGESTGRYTIPFVTPGGNTVPYTYDVTVPGVGSGGKVIISSWGTNDDNTVNVLTGGPSLPASVTQFSTENEWGNWAVQGGQKVINRFWSVVHDGYVTDPKGEYTFTYHLSEKPPMLVEGQLVAQRWNDIDQTWLDWLYSNTANTADKTVSVLIQNPEDQFSIWTLTDISDPLPIELGRFVGQCDNGEVVITWTTWTEISNKEFLLERSMDATDWEVVSTVPGAGDSNTPITYEVVTKHSGTAYYRLKDVGFDGSVGISGTIAVTCVDMSSGFSVRPNPTEGILFVDGVFLGEVIVTDMLGRNVQFSTQENMIDLSGLAAGTYNVRIGDKNHKIIKR